MAYGIDRNARQWIDRREKVFARGWRGRRDAAVSVFRERGLMMARRPVLYLVNGSGPSAWLAVAMGRENSGVTTNWASKWADCISGHKLLHWRILFPEIGYSTHAAILRQIRVVFFCVFAPVVVECSDVSDWHAASIFRVTELVGRGGGCWGDMEENHFGIRPNHLSHPTYGDSYVPKHRDV